MALFGGRRDDDLEDGYRRAEDGETPDMTLNGIPQVRKSDDREGDNGISRGIFNRVTSSQDEKYGDRDKNDKSKKRDDAASNLKKGESFASGVGGNVKKIMGMDGGSEEARQSESDVASGNWLSNIRGKDSAEERTRKRKKRFMRTIGPTLAAGCGVVGFGAMSFFGQMTLPFSFVSQLQMKFDSIGTSTTMRTKQFYRYQANAADRGTILGDPVKDYTKEHSRIYKVFTGNDNDYFKITPRQQAKLSKSGITVVEESPGVQVMKYTNPSNNVEYTIVPDANMASGENRVYIDDFYEKDTNFHDAYFSGARTWRGAVSSWFDKLANKFLSYFGVKRGVWAAYKQSGASEENLKKYKTTISDESKTNGIKGSASTTTNEEVVDDEGEPTGDLKVGDTDSDNLDIPEDASEAEVNEKTKSFVSGKAAKIVGAASQAASLICMATDIIGAINLIVMAYQTTQVIKTGMAIFEGTQKAQVESSQTTPISLIGDSYTKTLAQSITSVDVANTSVANTNSSNSTIATMSEDNSGSAMESENVKAMYEGRVPNGEDSSIKSFNISNAVNGVMKALGSSMAGFKACSFARLGAAIAGAVLDTIQVVGCILSFGIGCVVDILIDVAKAAAKSIALALITNLVISAFVPWVANILTRKFSKEVLGVDLGTAGVSAGNMIQGNNHLYTGGSLATESSLSSYLMERDRVIADTAAYESRNRDPMDYTSPYTFMGQLVTKTIPITIQSKGVVDTVGSLVRTVGSSISSLMPGASAVSSAVEAHEWAEYTSKYCPDLAEIGAVGDATCNPFIISDTKTMALDPAEVVYKVSQLGDNFEDESGTDVPIIKKDSMLARYILYCGQRQSPFGIADQNIATDFKNGTTGSTVGDSIVGAVPIVGSLVDIYNATEVIKNFGYISGESCVTDNNAPTPLLSKTSNWSENKYYQRFLEDQRLAESMGLVEKNSLTAFLDEYYEEHPIDNSFEGILARRSGLTKDQVIGLLDIMEGMEWIANYDPSGYYPLHYEEPEEERIEIEDDSIIDSGLVAITNNLFHEERRIKNFAV